jgi:hypothetical protein
MRGEALKPNIIIPLPSHGLGLWVRFLVNIDTFQTSSEAAHKLIDGVELEDESL